MKTLFFGFLLLLLTTKSVSSSVQLRRSSTTIKRRTKGKDVRIVGGSAVTNQSEYPYIGVLTGEIICGATLIHKDLMITAARCKGMFMNHSVSIGGNTIGGKGSKTYDVVEEIPHPRYNNLTLANDIMLLKLSNPCKTSFVRINFNPQIPNINQPLEILGYGATSANDTISFSETLQRARVMAAPRDRCDDIGGFRNDSMICSWFPSGERYSYKGDSGGAVLLRGRNVLVGIISYSEGPNRQVNPTTYTRVSFFADFIKNGIFNHSKYPPYSCDNKTTSMLISATASYNIEPVVKNKSKNRTTVPDDKITKKNSFDNENDTSIAKSDSQACSGNRKCKKEDSDHKIAASAGKHTKNATNTDNSDPENKNVLSTIFSMSNNTKSVVDVHHQKENKASNNN